MICTDNPIISCKHSLIKQQIKMIMFIFGFLTLTDYINTIDLNINIYKISASISHSFIFPLFLSRCLSLFLSGAGKLLLKKQTAKAIFQFVQSVFNCYFRQLFCYPSSIFFGRCRHCISLVA